MWANWTWPPKIARHFPMKHLGDLNKRPVLIYVWNTFFRLLPTALPQKMYFISTYGI